MRSKMNLAVATQGRDVQIYGFAAVENARQAKSTFNTAKPKSTQIRSSISLKAVVVWNQNLRKKKFMMTFTERLACKLQCKCKSLKVLIMLNSFGYSYNIQLK